jgi:hypothetical protein
VKRRIRDEELSGARQLIEKIISLDLKRALGG